jgi:peroxiredoxin
MIVQERLTSFLMAMLSFTKGMGMDLDMSVVGFGTRSRRYAMIVDNGVIEKMFAEPDATEDDPDPYGVSSPESVMEYLSGKYE